MPINKSSISPPVEAGQSLLDAKHLPPQLTTALEYVSSRLARKRLNVSLVVLRGDVHIPIAPSTQYPDSPSFPRSASPSRSPFTPTSLKRSASERSLSSLSTSSSTSLTSSTASLSRTNWPSLLASPKAAPSPQSPSTRLSTPASSNPYGITLVYASTLTVKAEKILRQSITKAEKKFSIGSGWLSSQPLSTWTNNLIHRSLIQNEVLFSSEGLTLLAVDHIYTFNCRLHTYSRSLSTSDWTSAVDELRRLVLAQQGRQITKAYLMQAYPWLGISLSILENVNEGYKIAYGGPRRFGGINLRSEDGQSPLLTNVGLKEAKRLRIRTNFENRNSIRISKSGGMTEHGCISLTSPMEDRGPHFRGPSTPNQGDDLTPVTKGEWSSLIHGGGWVAAKIAGIETC